MYGSCAAGGATPGRLRPARPGSFGDQVPRLAGSASALARVTRPPILTLFGALQVLAICAFGIARLAAPPDLAAPDPGTGDYLGGPRRAGPIVREGHGERLYDFDVQRQVRSFPAGGPRRWRRRFRSTRPALAMALSTATALGYTARGSPAVHARHGPRLRGHPGVLGGNALPPPSAATRCRGSLDGP